MAMTRDELVDRMGANAPPYSEKPNVVKGARRTAGANAPPAQPRWIRNVNDYDRRERRALRNDNPSFAHLPRIRSGASLQRPLLSGCRFETTMFRGRTITSPWAAGKRTPAVA
jgi:hypothetical protein